jgi:hypothetical protein
LNTNLQNAIKAWADAEQRLLEVHLFGSALQVSDPDDLDFIVVYDRLMVSVAEASRLRRGLKEAVHEVSDVPCDVTLLSKAEREQTQFVSEVRARPLWLRCRCSSSGSPLGRR